jgi:carbonic anhydrase
MGIGFQVDSIGHPEVHRPFQMRDARSPESWVNIEAIPSPLCADGRNKSDVDLLRINAARTRVELATEGNQVWVKYGEKTAQQDASTRTVWNDGCPQCNKTSRLEFA